MAFLYDRNQKQGTDSKSSYPSIFLKKMKGNCETAHLCLFFFQRLVANSFKIFSPFKKGRSLHKTQKQLI